MNDMIREKFEKVISGSPYEKTVERFADNGSWPGAYKDVAVHLAWNVLQDMLFRDGVSTMGSPKVHVTGYRDGQCIVQSVEGSVLPVGMALYAQPQVPEPISRALALINPKDVLHSGICPVAAQRIIFQMSEILTASQEQERGE